MTIAEDFTKEGVAKLIAENDDMLDDWSASRGIITYRRQLRNERDAAHARIAELEARVVEQAAALSTAKAEAEKMREATIEECASYLDASWAAYMESSDAVFEMDVPHAKEKSAAIAAVAAVLGEAANAIRALKEVEP